VSLFSALAIAKTGNIVEQPAGEAERDWFFGGTFRERFLATVFTFS